MRLSLSIIIPVIVIDQLIKLWVKTHMMLHESIEVTSWFQILFTENRGMAFGMSPVGTNFLAVFRIVAIAAFVYLLVSAVRQKAGTAFVTAMSLIVAGAIGNLIDNTFYGLIFSESQPYVYAPFAEPAHLVSFGEGYADVLTGRVVDMFYFPLFTWPEALPVIGGDVFFGAIFNFADAAISIGAVILAVCFFKKSLKENKAATPGDASAEASR